MNWKRLPGWEERRNGCLGDGLLWLNGVNGLNEEWKDEEKLPVE